MTTITWEVVVEDDTPKDSFHYPDWHDERRARIITAALCAAVNQTLVDLNIPVKAAWVSPANVEVG